MREIVAANGFCGVTELFENNTSPYFILGNFCFLPKRRPPKTPHSTSSPPQKAELLFDVPALLWIIIIWFDVFVDEHFTDIFWFNFLWFIPLPRPCVTLSRRLLELNF